MQQNQEPKVANGDIVVVQRPYAFIADKGDEGIVVGAPPNLNPGTQILVTPRGDIAIDDGDVTPTGRNIAGATLDRCERARMTGSLPQVLLEGKLREVPSEDEFQTYLYDDETDSGFIIRNEGDRCFKAEEWRDGDIADNTYGTYADMKAWTEACAARHNEWRVGSGYKAMDMPAVDRNNAASSTLQGPAPKDVPDPVVKVHPIGKPEGWDEWHISQNLTDQWGEINSHNAANKPLAFLEADSALLERLRAQMWDELTFIVRKDGQWGILYELEFCTRESDESEKDRDPVWYAALKPRNELVEALLETMEPLAERFPGVQFAVPDEAQVYSGRTAAWAFVPDGLLTEVQREELGRTLLGV